MGMLCLSIQGCILSAQKETHSLGCLQTRGQSGQSGSVSPMESSTMQPPKDERPVAWVSVSVDAIFAQ